MIVVSSLDSEYIFNQIEDVYKEVPPKQRDLSIKKPIFINKNQFIRETDDKKYLHVGIFYEAIGWNQIEVYAILLFVKMIGDYDQLKFTSISKEFKIQNLLQEYKVN